MILIIAFIHSRSTFGQTKVLNDSILYEITPVVKSDRTDFEISIFIRVENNEPLTISLISDRYGTSDIHNYITSFDAFNGTRILKTHNNQKTVAPDSDGNISLKYLISYDPKEVNISSFGPLVHQDYFNLPGCQWMLHIGDDHYTDHFIIQIKESPIGRVLHSSIGQNTIVLEGILSFKIPDPTKHFQITFDSSTNMPLRETDKSVRRHFLIFLQVVALMREKNQNDTS